MVSNLRKMSLLFTLLPFIWCTAEKGDDNKAAHSETPMSQIKLLSKKKILEIDSYHEQFQWTADITRGVKDILEPTGIEFHLIRLDTKRNQSEEFKKRAALAAKKKIDHWKPDLVITSDDNAVKYLVHPYFKNSAIPFVICGVNWEKDAYGLPYKNTVVQIERSHIQQTINLLKEHSAGDRIGIVIAESMTERKDVAYFKKICAISFEKEYFVTTFADWKEKFLKLQNEVDIMIFGSYPAIVDFDLDEAKSFIYQNCKIPIGTYNEDFMDFAMIGMVKKPFKIGQWCGRKALAIMNGKKPSDFKTEFNTIGELIINMKLCNKIGLSIPPDQLRIATIR